jgi:hypothetical protein
MKNGKCYVHGGKLKGGSIHRDTSKASAARKRWLELLHALGLKHPGGRSNSKLQKALTMAEEAKQLVVAGARDLAEALPSDVLTRPVESLSPAEALGRAALSGSYQLIRIIEQPLERDENGNLMDLKQQRLVGDMSAVALRLFVRAAGDEMRSRSDDVLGRLLAAIQADKEKS